MDVDLRSGSWFESGCWSESVIYIEQQQIIYNYLYFILFYLIIHLYIFFYTFPLLFRHHTAVWTETDKIVYGLSLKRHLIFYSGLMVVKPLNTIFILVLQYHPIRKLYLLDITVLIGHFSWQIWNSYSYYKAWYDVQYNIHRR